MERRGQKEVMQEETATLEAVAEFLDEVGGAGVGGGSGGGRRWLLELKRLMEFGCGGFWGSFGA